MKKHSRLYVQILSYFLVLSLLIGVVTAVTYFSFVRQQKLDFQRQMRGNMRSVHNEYSQIIYNICGIHQMFFEMPFVRESYVRLDEQTLEDKLATKEIIATLRNGLNALGNNIVVDIFTYNDDQRVYSIQGTSDSRHFFTHMNRFEDSGHEAWMEAGQLNEVWPGYREAREWVNRVYDACIQTLGMELYRYCDALRTEANKYLDIFLSRDGIDAQPLKTFVRMTVDLIPEANVAHGNYDLAQRIRTCIDTCYFEELSLAILADKMGVSDKYVSRVFKEEFQLNVSDYIALVRIEHAKQLMRNGIAINVAARQVGIESRATFIRVFRKLEGMTPSEYVSRSH